MARKRFAGLMLVSWFIPIIGGIIAYFLRKEEDPDLATILLVGSFVIPLQAVVGFTAGLLGISYVILGLPLTLVITYILIRVWSENSYRHLLWAFYLGILGAIYAYYWPYKEDRIIRSSVGRFAFGWLLIYVIVGTLLGSVASYLWMQNVKSQVATTPGV